MINKSKTKEKMPIASAESRIKNFEEVELGYSEESAINEASRCLGCKNKPCVSGCPVNVKIPDFIKNIREKNFSKSYHPKKILFIIYNTS